MLAQFNMVQAINRSLAEEMRRDPKVLLLGEDIGRNGGVFRATEGLYKEFGPNRVMDTPISESGIIGVSIGLALYGFKPVPEIQFLDFIYPGFDQIASELSKIRYRSGGEYTAPVVIRAPCGGGVKGGPYHSQNVETFFTHMSGLKVIMPSTPYDAKGLLKAAIRDKDPVIFLEPKRLYRHSREEVPEEDYVVPIGKAKKVREGNDLSIITYGPTVPTAIDAADKAAGEDVDVEIIDLRTLAPLDVEAIFDSVRKTGRVIVLYEACETMGFGAEISALIAEEVIDHIKAPITRLGGLDTPFPYANEGLYPPTPKRILTTIRKLMAY